MMAPALLTGVPLGMFGAVAVMFLKMPNPTLRYFTDGWATTGGAGG